jgi:acetyltransferase-like isoleucine patch superfamily enzyme
VVLPRVEIGEGAVVGAGAVVIHSVDPYSTVVGVPAKALPPRPVVPGRGSLNLTVTEHILQNLNNLG